MATPPTTHQPGCPWYRVEPMMTVITHSTAQVPITAPCSRPKPAIAVFFRSDQTLSSATKHSPQRGQQRNAPWVSHHA